MYIGFVYKYVVSRINGLWCINMWVSCQIYVFLERMIVKNCIIGWLHMFLFVLLWFQIFGAVRSAAEDIVARFHSYRFSNSSSVMVVMVS